MYVEPVGWKSNQRGKSYSLECKEGLHGSAVICTLASRTFLTKKGSGSNPCWVLSVWRIFSTQWIVFSFLPQSINMLHSLMMTKFPLSVYVSVEVCGIAWTGNLYRVYGAFAQQSIRAVSLLRQPHDHKRDPAGIENGWMANT